MLKTNLKKGQVGLITGLIFGVASLVIGVIIAFVIVNTLTGANLLSDNRDTVTVSNESGFVNSTGWTLAGSSANRAVLDSFSLVYVFNGTHFLTASNYTLASGVVTNLSGDFAKVNFTYTYNLYTNEEFTAESLNANFTKGVDNVSTKIPTVLLVAAIVLILGVLVLLVAAWQRMRIGGGSI